MSYKSEDYVDALLIKLRKRIGPTNLICDKKENVEMGGNFIALSHFSDFQFKRISTKDNGEERGKLSDMILPQIHNLQEEKEFEIQHIYLGEWVYLFKHSKDGAFKACYYLPGDKTDVRNKFCIEEENRDIPVMLVSGVKFNIDKSVNSAYGMLKSKHVDAINELLVGLFKDPQHKNKAFAIEIRKSLGFGDYCFLLRGESFDDLHTIYMELYKLAKERENDAFSGIRFVYSIPGIAEGSYKEFADNWNDTINEDNSSILLTTINSNEINGSDLYSFYSYGNYDLVTLNRVLPYELLQSNSRYKTILLKSLDKDRDFFQHKSVDDHRPSIDPIDLEEHWEKFNEIVEQNNEIGEVDKKRTLTNIHLLSLEHHLSFFGRHVVDDVIDSILLNEWNQILKDFLRFSTDCMKIISDNNDHKDKNLKHTDRNLINYFRNQFEESMSLINQAARHWVIGAKSQVEYAGSENIYHFGNASKIYSVYAKIFNVLQKVFSEVLKDLKEEVNFFAVPGNSSATYSTVLFSDFNPDKRRLIAVNISSEIIFNFKWLGLVMHEVGHYIAYNRVERNKAFKNLLQRFIASQIADYFYDTFTDIMSENFENRFPRSSILFPYIKDQAYKITSEKIRENFSELFEKLISQEKDGGEIDLKSKYYLPLDSFSDVIRNCFPPLGLNDLIEASDFKEIDKDSEDIDDYRVKLNKESKYFNSEQKFELKSWKEVSIESKLVSSISEIPKNVMDVLDNFKDQYDFYFNHRHLLFSEERDQINLSDFTKDITRIGFIRNHYEHEKIKRFIKIFYPKEDAEKKFRKHFPDKKWDDYSIKTVKDLIDELGAGANKHPFFLDFNFDFGFLEEQIIVRKNLQEIITNGKEFQEFESRLIDSVKEKENTKSKKDALLLFLRNEKFIKNGNDVLEEACFNFYYLGMVADEDEFYAEYERSKFDLCNKLSEVMLLSKSEIENGELKTLIRNILFNKTLNRRNKGRLLGSYLVESNLNYLELIKETKADYFMCKILGFSKDQYLEQFNFNTNAEIDYKKHEEQLSRRCQILKIAGAFRDEQPIDFASRKNQSEHEIIAKIITDSVDPVIEQLLSYEIIKDCRRVVNSEKGLKDELEFIENVLQAKDSLG